MKAVLSAVERLSHSVLTRGFVHVAAAAKVLNSLVAAGAASVLETLKLPVWTSVKESGVTSACSKAEMGRAGADGDALGTTAASTKDDPPIARSVGIVAKRILIGPVLQFV